MLLFAALSVAAQGRLNVRGIVFDSSTLHTMPGAAVKLFGPQDSLIVGGVTEQNGQYLLPSVPTGTYTLQVSFLGYKTQRLSLTLPNKTGNYKVSDVLMREEAKLLDEAVVTAKAMEMTVQEDTVVYNAAAFIVTEGAVVEELVKKLPGVTIDESGNYFVNGKQVSEFLVDGKEFFGGNRELILRNLPADIVDRVKTYDKKSDLARITGIDDGNEKTVLDLIVKKDKKRGWFGNVDAGGGTQERYAGRTNINRFRGEDKLAIVGNVGNTGGNGTTDNQSAAINMQHQNDKLEIGGSVNGNWSQSDSWSESSVQSFESKRAAFSNSRNSNSGRNRGGGLQMKMEWKPDTMTNVIFRPHLNIGGNNSEGESESASFNNDPYTVVADPLRDYETIERDMRVNHNRNNNHNESSNWSMGASLQVNRRLQKVGRNLTLNLEGGMGNNTGESASYAQIDYYQIMALTGEDSVYHKIQYNDTRNKNRNWSGRLSYTEPLGDRIYLQASYNFSYQWQDQDRTVASIFDPWNDDWTRDTYRDWHNVAQPDVEQCRYVENHNYNHDIRLQLRMNRTRYRFTVGVNVRPMTNRTEYEKGRKHYDLSRTVCNVAPTLNCRYRFSKTEQIEIRYNGSTNQPGIQQLIPDTLNNANPLNISLGNPGLVPSFTHKINGSYNRSVPDLQRSFAVNMTYNATQNAVANRTEYNEETGGRVSRPENINGNWNARASFNFNTAFMGDTRFRMNMGTQLGHTNAVGYVYRSSEQATVKNRTRGTNMSQSLRFTFHSDYIEANVNGGVHYNRSRSTANTAGNLDTWRFNYGGQLIANLPWNMQLSTDIGQHSRRGYSDSSMNTNELIWNASISQSFLKGNAATVRVTWHDILAQRDDVSRNVSATSRTDRRSQLLSNYVMMHFAYRFNFFGGKGDDGRASRRGGRGRLDNGEPWRPGPDGGRKNNVWD